nr:FAD-dependent oxidoreductase [Actinomycetota bacterium]
EEDRTVGRPGRGMVLLVDDDEDMLAALRAALEDEGGEQVEGVEVTDLADLRAEQVVVAAGAWSGAFTGPGPLKIRPVKGQILRLRDSEPPLASRIVRTPRCYVVPRATGEIVVGATVEERGFDDAVTAGGVHRLLEAAWEALPDVEERALVETAVGFRPGTPDNAPVVGRDADGVIWATGHHRNGVLLAPITATAVAGWLAGEKKGSDPFFTFSKHFVPVAGSRA